MSNLSSITLETEGKIVLKGNCECQCGGGGGTGSCPHPSFPFMGIATADFAKTERCMAVGGGAFDNVTFTKMPFTDPKATLYYARDIAISDDGYTIVTAGANNASIGVVKWDGTQYVNMPAPIGMSNSGTPILIVMTGDASRFVLAQALSAVVELYDYNGTNYEKTAEISASPSTSIRHMSMTRDGKTLLLVGGGSNNEQALVLDWDDTQNLYVRRQPTINLRRGEYFTCSSVTDDGNTIALGGWNDDATRNLVVYEFNGLIYTERPVDELSEQGCSQGALLSNDGNKIIAVGGGGMFGYDWDGSQYVKVAETSSTCVSPKASADCSFIVGGNQGTLYKWSGNTIEFQNNVFNPVFQYRPAITRDGTKVVGGSNGIPRSGFYWRDPASLGQIRPFVSIEDAAQTEGLRGIGFTRSAIAEGATGIADIMFE